MSRARWTSALIVLSVALVASGCGTSDPWDDARWVVADQGDLPEGHWTVFHIARGTSDACVNMALKRPGQPPRSLGAGIGGDLVQGREPMTCWLDGYHPVELSLVGIWDLFKEPLALGVVRPDVRSLQFTMQSGAVVDVPHPQPAFLVQTPNEPISTIDVRFADGSQAVCEVRSDIGGGPTAAVRC